jgi:predicted TIM-barrel fold metal-dependent hydrolase
MFAIYRGSDRNWLILKRISLPIVCALRPMQICPNPKGQYVVHLAAAARDFPQLTFVAYHAGFDRFWMTHRWRSSFTPALPPDRIHHK